ncbi:MAG: FAD-binding oxidoreductase [Bacteroidota bacterium]
MPEIILPKVELNIHTPRDPVTATIAENYIVTSSSSPNFIRHITFDISGTDLVGRIKCGQAIGVLPPGTNEKGRPRKIRLYSVSSPDEGEGGDPTKISTTVKRVLEECDNKLYVGVASNYLADLQPGDEVQLTGPSGRRFLMPENATEFNYVFFATGTGIAPYRAMIQQLYSNGFDKSCVLIFGCPYQTDLLYESWLNDVENEQPDFHYLKSISREGRRADGSKDYVQTKLIDEESLLRPILEKPETLVYICGLQGMEDGIYRELLRQKLHGYFEPGRPLPDNADNLDSRELKRALKPSSRLFVEVY